MKIILNESLNMDYMFKDVVNLISMKLIQKMLKICHICSILAQQLKI